MRPLLAVAGKDLRDILRERSILVSLAVQLFIAGFSTFLSVGLTGLYDPGAIEAFPRADVAYAGPGGFDAYLDDARNLDVERMSADEGRTRFLDGRVDAVVEETWSDADATRTVTLLLPEGTIEGTLLLTQLKSMLQEYEHDLRVERSTRLVQPLVVAPEPPEAAAGSFAFVYGSLLPLLVLTPVFLSGAIAGDSFVHEAQTKSLLILRSTPLSGAGIVAAKMLVPILLAPAQVALWIGLFALNGLPVANLAILLGLAAILALLLASFSLAIATWVRQEGQVQAAYALLVLLLAVASLLLPHDPMNLVALLATDSLSGSVWTSVALLGLASLAAASVCLPLAARRIRRDQAQA